MATEKRRSKYGSDHSELRRILKSHRLFQWSKDDEIILLNNLFQFSGKNGYYTTDFYNFVKNMLSIEVSENQLRYVIYCLRKDYKNNNNNSEVNVMDSHTLKVLELSKKIWDGPDINGIGDDDDEIKTKLRDDYYKRSLEEYVEELGFDVNCLTSVGYQEIMKEWQHFKFVENQFHLMNNKLDLQLYQYKINNQLGAGDPKHL